MQITNSNKIANDRHFFGSIDYIQRDNSANFLGTLPVGDNAEDLLLLYVNIVNTLIIFYC